MPLPENWDVLDLFVYGERHLHQPIAPWLLETMPNVRLHPFIDAGHLHWFRERMRAFHPPVGHELVGALRECKTWGEVSWTFKNVPAPPMVYVVCMETVCNMARDVKTSKL